MIIGEVEFNFGSGGDLPPGLQDPQQFRLWLLLLPWLAINFFTVRSWREIRSGSSQAQRDKLTAMLIVYFFVAIFSVVMIPPGRAVLLCYLFLAGVQTGLWQARRRMITSPPGLYQDPMDGKTKWWDGQRWLE